MREIKIVARYFFRGRHSIFGHPNREITSEGVKMAGINLKHRRKHEWVWQNVTNVVERSIKEGTLRYTPPLQTLLMEMGVKSW
jgi:hypothetical protein